MFSAIIEFIQGLIDGLPPIVVQCIVLGLGVFLVLSAFRLKPGQQRAVLKRAV